MNTSKIIVRLDEEQRTADLEIMTPHAVTHKDGIERALRRTGIRTLRTIELSTPRYRVIRLRLAEFDGSTLREARVTQILSIAQERRVTHATYRGQAA